MTVSKINPSSTRPLEATVRAKSETGKFLAHHRMPEVQRYATANRNSFMKNLDLLSKAKQAEELSKATEAEEEDAEAA